MALLNCIACQKATDPEGGGMRLRGRRVLCDECVRSHYQTEQFTAIKVPYDTPNVAPAALPPLWCTGWEVKAAAYGDAHAAIVWGCTVFVPRPAEE